MAIAMLVVYAIMLWAGVPRIIARVLDSRIESIRKQLDEAGKLRAAACLSKPVSLDRLLEVVLALACDPELVALDLGLRFPELRRLVGASLRDAGRDEAWTGRVLDAFEDGWRGWVGAGPRSQAASAMSRASDVVVALVISSLAMATMRSCLLLKWR